MTTTALINIIIHPNRQKCSQCNLQCIRDIIEWWNFVNTSINAYINIYRNKYRSRLPIQCCTLVLFFAGNSTMRWGEREEKYNIQDICQARVLRNKYMLPWVKTYIHDNLIPYLSLFFKFLNKERKQFIKTKK